MPDEAVLITSLVVLVSFQAGAGDQDLPRLAGGPAQAFLPQRRPECANRADIIQ